MWVAAAEPERSRESPYLALAIPLCVSDNHGVLLDAGDGSSVDRRSEAASCATCGSPVYETHYTASWGGKTRLLVCTNPDCGKVASEEERRMPQQRRNAGCHSHDD